MVAFPGQVECADPVADNQVVTLNYLKTQLPAATTYFEWNKNDQSGTEVNLGPILAGIYKYREVIVHQWYYEDNYTPAFDFGLTNGNRWVFGEGDHANLMNQQGKADGSVEVASPVIVLTPPKVDNFVAMFTGDHKASFSRNIHWRFSVTKGSQNGPGSGFSMIVECTMTNQFNSQSYSKLVLSSFKDGSIESLKNLYVANPVGLSYGNAYVVQSA